MTTTYVEAIDEIFDLIITSWNAQSPAACGYAPTINWPNMQKAESKPIDKHWLRVIQRTISEKQSALRARYNTLAKTRYTNDGIIIVQLFVSKSSLKDDHLRKLSVILRNIFRGKGIKAGSGKVWFRNAKIVEVDPEETWFRANVTTEYQFDEIA